MVTPASIRICVCGPDDELRGWIVEELQLMTWVGGLEVDSISGVSEDALRPDAYDVVIAGIDGISPADAERLARRSWTTPLIAVGTPAVGANRTLSSKLTSRDLKSAVRELLADRLAVRR